MPPVVADGQPDEGATGERVRVGAALAGQVRQEPQPVAAGRDVRGGGRRDRRTRRPGASVSRNQRRLPAADSITDIRCQRSGHGVAEGMDAAARLERSAGPSARRRRPEVPSERAGVPGSTAPSADGVCGLVSAAGDDRRSGAQTGGSAAAAVTEPVTVGALERLGQPAAVDPRARRASRATSRVRPGRTGWFRRRRPCRRRGRRSAAGGRSPSVAGRGRSCRQTSGS